ncbi:MarR family winged helix-turn-helix transcriptional regulator [Tropicimonas sp. IMCC6043]|uniref:MarR family winged helix-turn-helix transcriptional regulator n=1 Tax=Tropicimonas sp. IMCC6043 TaxID=2510645 RepID=UPI00101C19A5|nr:MarR family transcriptional regulator [Tropicimonas sp. IMCC6043]RYH06802.1 MarR family transcriptional regulator [Tropicimonas sp. IMCC6043]
MELYEMAGHLIRRLHQNSTHVFQVRTRDAGLDMTPVQFAAMSAIHEAPGIDQATVAARIAYDRATIGGVMDRLEQKGWISRQVSKRDRRAKEVSLTDDGNEVYRKAISVVRDLQSEILPGLCEQEQGQFLELARKAAAHNEIT